MQTNYISWTQIKHQKLRLLYCVLASEQTSGSVNIWGKTMAFSSNPAERTLDVKTHIKCTNSLVHSSRFSMFIEHFKHLSFRDGTWWRWLFWFGRRQHHVSSSLLVTLEWCSPNRECLVAVRLFAGWIYLTFMKCCCVLIFRLPMLTKRHGLFN